jgi:hypothetical protein
MECIGEVAATYGGGKAGFVFYLFLMEVCCVFAYLDEAKSNHSVLLMKKISIEIVQFDVMNEIEFVFK